MRVSINTTDPRPIYLKIMDETRRAVVLGTRARGVAERALLDAHRNGLGADELLDAIREVADQHYDATADASAEG